MVAAVLVLVLVLLVLVLRLLMLLVLLLLLLLLLLVPLLLTLARSAAAGGRAVVRVGHSGGGGAPGTCIRIPLQQPACVWIPEVIPAAAHPIMERQLWAEQQVHMDPAACVTVCVWIPEVIPAVHPAVI